MKRHHDEFETTERSGAGKHVFTGLLVGSLVGAVTMLLFAPRSGDETRAGIRSRAIDLRDRTAETVKDTVSQARSRAGELKDSVRARGLEMKRRGREVAREQLERISEAAETGTQTVREY